MKYLKLNSVDNKVCYLLHPIQESVRDLVDLFQESPDTNVRYIRIEHALSAS